jgi:hypothetical protein
MFFASRSYVTEQLGGRSSAAFHGIEHVQRAQDPDVATLEMEQRPRLEQERAVVPDVIDDLEPLLRPVAQAAPELLQPQDLPTLWDAA